MSSTTKDERNVQGRTRGVKNDAYKQERELDDRMQDSGIMDAEQDIEIGAASGRN